MKTLTTLFVTLVLLITIGLRTLDTNFALNEVNDALAMAQTVAGVDGGSDGDGATGSDAYNSWAG